MSEFGKWTAVKDELPPEPEFSDDGYIVQTSDVVEPFSAYWTGEYWVDSMDSIIAIDKVIAWMPLPEPYKPADPIEEIKKEVENNKSAIKNFAKDILEIMKNEGRFKTEFNGIYKDMATIVNQISDLARHQEEHRVEIARIKMKMEENDEE